mgnify:FL=1
MKMKKIILFFLTLCSTNLLCQEGAQIFKQLKKLNTLASVLYVAAHPDDENTRLISLFSNQYNARTAYLSMTRGDGGQNLIGTELREGLGLIRTQELIEARKIDGGEQFFTTANDFGFSKHPEETLSIWNEKEILSQIVFRFRQFKPDIIIHRFDHRTPGATHGHHTSSAILSEKAFHLANDPKAFSKQLKTVSLWQPKLQFYNLSWWAYGEKDKFDIVDKSDMIALESNPFLILLGKTNEEVAAKSRSQHKSQGFGSSPRLGSQTEYLELINGNKTINTNPFNGIDTSWNRIKGGKIIQKLVESVIDNFELEKPYNSIPDLLKIHKKILTLEDKHWKNIKLNEVKNIIKNCLGLRLQFNTTNEVGAPNMMIPINIKALNPSPIPISLKLLSKYIKIESEFNLSKNQVLEISETFKIPDVKTTPYWLLNEADLGNYKVENELLKGLPETPYPIKIQFKVFIYNNEIIFDVPLTYRITDQVNGEIIQNFQVLPKVTTQLSKKVLLFKDNTPKEVRVNVTSHVERFDGLVTLKTPIDWSFTPKNYKVQIEKIGETKEYIFKINPPNGNKTGFFSSLVTEDQKSHIFSLDKIYYPHISKQYLLTPNKTLVSKVNIKSKVKKVAYLKGAGDKIVESLENIGLKVTEFDVENLRLETILPFPTLIVGIRAFNINNDLKFKNKILWDYVKKGGTLIVQYNTSRGLDSSIVAPYPINLSRDRVTDENADVKFLIKDHPILNHPNKISSKDFEGWVQERGLYFPRAWDKKYQAVLSMSDKGEEEKKGSLLVADYGEGKFIYTGLSFFRELPEGVPGAYRLFLNLISYGK